MSDRCESTRVSRKSSGEYEQRCDLPDGHEGSHESTDQDGERYFWTRDGMGAGSTHTVTILPYAEPA